MENYLGYFAFINPAMASVITAITAQQTAIITPNGYVFILNESKVNRTNILPTMLT